MTTELIQNELISRFGSDIREAERLDSLKDQLPDTDTRLGPLFLRDYLRACEKCALIAATVTREREDAKTAAKAAFSEAVLVRFNDHIWPEGSRPKDSMDARKAFAEFDPIYRNAKERENALAALAEYFNIKSRAFEHAYYACKEIYRYHGSTPVGRHEDDGGIRSGGNIGDEEDRFRRPPPQDR